KLRGDILRALTEQLGNFSGTFLDIGCGRMPYKSLLLAAPARVKAYIGLDVACSPHAAADIYFDGERIPLRDAAIDSAMATEVLEHCSEPGQILREVCRVLKPGGFFFFTVPFLWPLHEVPHDFYRYTPFALKRLLAVSGFDNIIIRQHGGWDSALAQMLGLWVTYRGMRPWKRALLSRLMRPVIRSINHMDSGPTTAEFESGMFTGLSGTARRTLRPQ
ncbi:MAG: pimB 3, partial [Verrucomicrobiales bacterium]|nr:pimB 3 [Verrucomicrobiales bacterium]